VTHTQFYVPHLSERLTGAQAAVGETHGSDMQLRRLAFLSFQVTGSCLPVVQHATQPQCDSRSSVPLHSAGSDWALSLAPSKAQSTLPLYSTRGYYAPHTQTQTHIS